MQTTQKIYQIQTVNNETIDIKCDIYLGFDKEKLLNHPFPTKDNKISHFIFMFIPEHDFDKQWFINNKNSNPLVNVSTTTMDDFELIIKIVDKIFEQQSLAVKQFVNDIKTTN